MHLKLQGTGFSETLVLIYQTTLRHISEDRNIKNSPSPY